MLGTVIWCRSAGYTSLTLAQGVHAAPQTTTGGTEQLIPRPPHRPQATALHWRWRAVVLLPPCIGSAVVMGGNAWCVRRQHTAVDQSGWPLTHDRKQKRSMEVKGSSHAERRTLVTRHPCWAWRYIQRRPPCCDGGCRGLKPALDAAAPAAARGLAAIRTAPPAP